MMIALNCETDFVAKNADFVAFACSVSSTRHLLRSQNSGGGQRANLEGGRTIAESIIEQSGIIGEKVELSYLQESMPPTFSHIFTMGNKLSTMVGFTKAGVDIQVYKDVAMQIAAMNPVAVDKG
jgi:elongation factor Ts